jgi:hypothetical protein
MEKKKRKGKNDLGSIIMEKMKGREVVDIDLEKKVRMNPVDFIRMECMKRKEEDRLIKEIDIESSQIV